MIARRFGKLAARFVVRLANPTGATLAKPAGIGTIEDTPPPGPNQQPEDNQDKPRHPTPSQRYQRQHTNAGSPDDTETRGQIAEIRRDAVPPVVVIRNVDGLVGLTLTGDALKLLDRLQVGQHVAGEGQKIDEHHYTIDNLGSDD